MNNCPWDAGLGWEEGRRRTKKKKWWWWECITGLGSKSGL